MKTFTSPSQKIGKIGEDVGCTYLVSKGYRVIERNFTRKWGEIDIIAEKDGVVHFVEVKSVTEDAYGDPGSEKMRPEDQLHAVKQKCLIRTIESYMDKHPVSRWQVDLLCVFLNMRHRSARVKVLPDVILG